MSDMCMEMECEVNPNPNIREIVANNYQLMVKLEDTLCKIADELRKEEYPQRLNQEVNDMSSALTEQNTILCRCNDHANYIKRVLGIVD